MTDNTAASGPALTIAIAASANADHGDLRAHLMRAGLLNRTDIRVGIAVLDGQTMDADESNLSVFMFSQRTPFFEQYLAIIQQTESCYIALLDASCPPTREWLTAVLQKMNDRTPVFFGPVNSGWPEQDSRNTGYLIEYAQFRAPIDPELPEYPGNNMAFRRTLLQEISLVGKGFQKTFFLHQVKEKLGITPTACNDMQVTYLKQYPWRYYLRRRFCHGRLYGASHAEILGARRFLYAAGILILPLLRYSRIFRASKRPPTLSREVLNFTMPILVSETAWALGECAGYIAGTPEDGFFID